MTISELFRLVGRRWSSALLIFCFISIVFCQDSTLKAEEIDPEESLFSTLDIVILVSVIGKSGCLTLIIIIIFTEPREWT